MIQLLAQTAFNGVVNAGLYLMLSLGLYLVFGVLRIANFAQGSLMVVGSYLAFSIATAINAQDPLRGILPTIACVTLLLFALGVLVYYATLRPLTGNTEMNGMLVTFALAVIAESAVQLTWAADYRSLPSDVASWTIGSVSFSPLTLAVVVMGFAGALLLLWFLDFTEAGRTIRAIAHNRTGAHIIGINVGLVEGLIFGVAAAMSGLAGTMYVYLFPIYPALGLEVIMKAFAVVIISGMRSVTALIAASLILGIAESLVSTLLNPTLGTIVSYVVIIVVLLTSPNGLKRLQLNK